MSKLALIIGVGPGISIAFAKRLALADYRVALASRNLEKLASIADSLPGGADIFQVDAGNNDSIVALFNAFDAKYGGRAPDVVLYNPSGSAPSTTTVSGEIP